MKELKIIFKTSQDFLTTSNVIISIDNDQIGMIQDIKLNVTPDQLEPELEIKFPNLDKIPNCSQHLKDHLADNIKKLSKFKNIKIIMEV